MLLEYLMNPGLTQIGNAGIKMLERIKPGDTEHATPWNILSSSTVLILLPSIFFSHPKWDT